MSLPDVKFKNNGKDVSLEDLFGQIYNNSVSTRLEIKEMIDGLLGKIKTPQDAQIMVPLIAKYLENLIDNDEALIKLATIIQRIVNKAAEAGNGGDFVLSDEERKQLLEQVNQVIDEEM